MKFHLRFRPPGHPRLAHSTMLSFNIVVLLLATYSLSAAQERDTATAPAQTCAPDNGGITLPSGFCATVFADNIGHARHLTVAPNGAVYVNTWSGEYYLDKKPPRGGLGRESRCWPGLRW